jgi:hypothetical protein
MQQLKRQRINPYNPENCQPGFLDFRFMNKRRRNMLDQRVRTVLLLVLMMGLSFTSAYSNDKLLKEKAVLDVDLTKGSAGKGVVTGGKWDKGWRVTDYKGQRIVFDPGQVIKNGYLEVTFTMNGEVKAVPPGKINWFGIYESPLLTQVTSTKKSEKGDTLYIRSEVNQSQKVKAFVGEVDEHFGSLLEKEFAKAADYPADDKTKMTMRIEWKNGAVSFQTHDGKKIDCPENCKNAVNGLRYVVLGGDRYSELSLKGVRFLRVKLVETN